MVNLTKSTKSAKQKDIVRKWHLIDATGRSLGRVATQISRILQGKNKTDYVDYLDSGDYAVIINAKKVGITGRKAQNEFYSRYSGYPDGLKKISFKNLLEKNPKELFRSTISGMLPKNKLRDRRLTRLYIFPDKEHTFEDKFKKINK